METNELVAFVILERIHRAIGSGAVALAEKLETCAILGKLLDTSGPLESAELILRLEGKACRKLETIGDLVLELELIAIGSQFHPIFPSLDNRAAAKRDEDHGSLSKKR
jgi:hypothetical protein